MRRKERKRWGDRMIDTKRNMYIEREGNGIKDIASIGQRRKETKKGRNKIERSMKWERVSEVAR